MQREIDTSRPIPKIRMLTSWFSSERCSEATTNDHRRRAKRIALAFCSWPLANNATSFRIEFVCITEQGFDNFIG